MTQYSGYYPFAGGLLATLGRSHHTKLALFFFHTSFFMNSLNPPLHQLGLLLASFLPHFRPLPLLSLICFCGLILVFVIFFFYPSSSGFFVLSVAFADISLWRAEWDEVPTMELKISLFCEFSFVCRRRKCGSAPTIGYFFTAVNESLEIVQKLRDCWRMRFSRNLEGMAWLQKLGNVSVRKCDI